MINSTNSWLLACLVLSYFSFGCQQETPVRTISAGKNQAGNTSCKSLGIINGTMIAASEFPEIVKYETRGSPCTGTFISPNVMISAIHCISDFGAAKTPTPNIVTISSRNLVATKVFYHPDNPLLFQDLENNDLAIAVFPDNTSSTFRSVDFTAPATNDAVEMVGYGPSTLTGTDDAKRKGVNKIQSIDVQGRLYLRQQNGGISAPGDSGGPLMRNGKLIGTVIGGGGGESLYTNLSSARNKAFLEDVALNQGVKICGINLNCDGTGTPAPGTTMDDGKNTDAGNMGDDDEVIMGEDQSKDDSEGNSDSSCR